MQSDDQGLVNTDPRTIAVPDGFVNMIPTDVRGLTFSRTPQMVGVVSCPALSAVMCYTCPVLYCPALPCRLSCAVAAVILPCPALPALPAVMCHCCCDPAATALHSSVFFALPGNCKIICCCFLANGISHLGLWHATDSSCLQTCHIICLQHWWQYDNAVMLACMQLVCNWYDE